MEHHTPTLSCCLTTAQSNYYLVTVVKTVQIPGSKCSSDSLSTDIVGFNFKRTNYSPRLRNGVYCSQEVALWPTVRLRIYKYWIWGRWVILLQVWGMCTLHHLDQYDITAILNGVCRSLLCFNRAGNSMQGYQALRVTAYILRNVFYFIRYILFYNSIRT